ncbi:MAG: 50S ribosomal protein L16 [bacterium]|nr:50S ribosomal protein L16 [bacterium]
MLMPRKMKHRKQHKRSATTVATAGTTLAFGTFGLRSLESSWVTARSLEAARRAMTRYVQRSGKIWIRAFPDKPRTAKGNEVPMGGGKGAVDHFVAVVRKGQILFEMDGIPEQMAEEALTLAARKLPVQTIVVKRITLL